MFGRQRTGSVVCASCGFLVGVNDDRCYNCGRRNPGLWGFAPAIRRLGHDLGFVTFVTGACVTIYVIMLVLSGGGLGRGGLFGLLAPNEQVLILFGASGAWPVFLLDRWWTVLSAAWLHGNLLHILFNVLWIRQLGPGVAELYGPGRMIVIYTAGAIAGFALSSAVGQYLPFLPPPFRGADLTVGASAPIFGLLGALVYYGRRTGSRVIHAQAVSWALILFVFGLVMPRIDNFAHAGGFLGGWVAARALDPLRPERIDHLVAALVCLVLSILSVVASIVHGLSLR